MGEGNVDDLDYERQTRLKMIPAMEQRLSGPRQRTEKRADVPLIRPGPIMGCRV